MTDETSYIFTESDNAPLMTITPTANIEICCKSGENVRIDASGEEVVVTGASEEGASIFFIELLKPMIDDYMKNG